MTGTSSMSISTSRPVIDERPAFEVPSHYRDGEARRLKSFGSDKNWWLNVDYVDSGDEPDFEMLRLLIRKNRETKQIS